MERITTMDFQINQYQHQQIQSKTDLTASISNDKLTAMGDVIDRWRLNKGWNPLDNDSQMLAISSWVNVMDSEDVPASAYNELFVRALKLRASLFAQGKQPPELGVELMLACWDSLRREIEEKRISDGRTLTASAETQCPKCFGSNFEYKFDENGNKLGIIGKCSHD